ncbi:hypothetical protein [Bacteroides caecimuris]|uniref:hypothetical protein n=1 Tax=Bacteroides caecimuris TaxID=1796613 RepID=UPI0020CDAE15|nr:hypothetical protein [Bacteroides caecimuris]
MTIISTHIKTAKTQKEKKQKGVSPKAERTPKSMGQWSKKTINSILKMYGGSRQNLWIIQPKAMEVFRKNDRRQTMIFYSDLYFKTIVGYTIPSVQAN